MNGLVVIKWLLGYFSQCRIWWWRRPLQRLFWKILWSGVALLQRAETCKFCRTPFIPYLYHSSMAQNSCRYLEIQVFVVNLTHNQATLQWFIEFGCCRSNINICIISVTFRFAWSSATANVFLWVALMLIRVLCRQF